MNSTVNSPTWPRVTQEKPCPACGKADWCRVSPDGELVWCGRESSGAIRAQGGGWLHKGPANGQSHGGSGEHRPAPKAPSKTAKTYPTPEAAIEAARWQVEQQEGQPATFAHEWPYIVNGGEVLRVVRFNLADEDKRFRPIHPVTGGWRIGDPAGPLPLYRHDELAAGGLAWVCEGEKAADAAADIGLASTTSAHGAKSAAKTDWSTLAGRECIILPDADEPSEGYARDVSALLMKLTPPARVKLLRLPGLAAGSGDDLVEWLELDGRDCREPEALRAEIEALAAGVPDIDPSAVVGGPVLRCLRDVQAEAVKWLWEWRFALGKLSLIGAPPGTGKMWLSLYLVAAVTRGLAWTDGRGKAPLGSAIIANAEDGAADTLKPRLLAMGADCAKVHVLDCVKRPTANGKVIERGFTLADVGDLEAAIASLKDCRLVVIDPVSAFLADADEHRNGEVRALLKPIVRLGEKYGCAIVCVTHLTKSGGSNSVHRMIGSIGFAGAARSVWMLSKDQHNPARRLMTLAKCNIAADAGGLAFSIVDGALAFEKEPVSETADELLAAEIGEGNRPGPAPVKRKAAEDWLRTLLAGGAVEAAKIQTEAEAAGFKWRTVQGAAEAMEIIREKNAFNGGWQWRFPKPGTEGTGTRCRVTTEGENSASSHLRENQWKTGDSACRVAEGTESNHPCALGADGGQDTPPDDPERAAGVVAEVAGKGNAA